MLGSRLRGICFRMPWARLQPAAHMQIVAFIDLASILDIVTVRPVHMEPSMLHGSVTL